MGLRGIPNRIVDVKEHLIHLIPCRWHRGRGQMIHQINWYVQKPMNHAYTMYLWLHMSDIYEDKILSCAIIRSRFHNLIFCYIIMCKYHLSFHSL